MRDGVWALAAAGDLCHAGVHLSTCCFRGPVSCSVLRNNIFRLPRCRAREENKAKARALWQQGNRTAAFECYSRAVDISPVVAKGFIDVGAPLAALESGLRLPWPPSGTHTCVFGPVHLYRR